MKFVADVMLGKLAKRMRLLGFDVAYDRNATDNDLIRVSLEDGRVILTRDRALTERPLAASHFIIANDSVRDQLLQIIETYGLSMGIHILTRCSICNTTLEQINRGTVSDRVPPHVYQKNKEFFQCTNCSRIYWKGTHVKRMKLNEEK